MKLKVCYTISRKQYLVPSIRFLGHWHLLKDFRAFRFQVVLKQELYGNELPIMLGIQSFNEVSC